MRTEEIRYVTEVCRTGSMACAARNMNITPQGLGKAIQKLEKDLGVKLFTRTFEGVVPTPICNQIFGKFNQIVDAENAVLELVRQSVAERREEETFLISPSTVGVFAETAVKNYNRKYDGKIRIVETTLLDELQEQEFIKKKYTYRCCCREDTNNRTLAKEEISKMKYLPIVSEDSPLLEKEMVNYEDLSSMVLLVEDERHPHIHVLKNQFVMRKLPMPTIRNVTTNTDVISMRLKLDPNAVFFARSRDAWLLSHFKTINFYPPFYTTLCLETHKKNINQELLWELREYFLEFNG